MGKYLLAKFFYEGVSNRMPLYLRKQIILCNRFVLFTICLGVPALVYYSFQSDWYGIISFTLLGGIAIITFWFNNLKLTTASRLFFTLLSGMAFSIPFLLDPQSQTYQIHGVGYGMIVFTIIPALLFHFRREPKLFLFTASFSCLYFLFYDFIFFSTIGVKLLWQNQYFLFVKLPQIVVVFIIYSFLLFLRSVTLNFEDRLMDAYQDVKTSSRELRKAMRQVATRNEELHAQQEQIINQKNYIEQQHDELKVAHDKLQQYFEELQATQEGLLLQEAKNRSLVEALKKFYFVAEFSASGVLENINNLLLDSLKIEKNRIIGKPVNELNLEWEEGDIDFKQFWDRMNVGKSTSMNILFSAKEGGVWVTFTLAPILNSKGVLTKILAVGNDITLLKQTQEEIRTQNALLKKSKEEILTINEALEDRVEERTKALQEQNRQLSEYAFINAHILRGPVSSIKGLVNLLELEGQDGELIEFLRKSVENLDEVVVSINDAISDNKHFSRDHFRQMLNE